MRSSRPATPTFAASTGAASASPPSRSDSNFADLSVSGEPSERSPRGRSRLSLLGIRASLLKTPRIATPAATKEFLSKLGQAPGDALEQFNGIIKGSADVGAQMLMATLGSQSLGKRAQDAMLLWLRKNPKRTVALLDAILQSALHTRAEYSGAAST